MDKNNYIDRIVSRLKPLNPYKIILFGSYAYGKPAKDSDIDIIVVLNNDDMPKTFNRKMKYQLLVKDAILDINKEVPIDLLVYTLPMYNKFKKLGSMFSKEISQKGKVLYEANKQKMA